MENKKQTAIEWLIKSQKQITQQYNNNEIIFSQCINMIEIIIEQAKEMEKEQIEEAYKSGWDAGDFGSDCWEEIYYKETYETCH
jgi:hypothetical protein